MKITFYTNNKVEILVIKNDDGKIIKQGLYSTGNCLVDILYGDKIISGNTILDIDPKLKPEITQLLELCSDYLHNNISKIIEKEFGFIFEQKFLYQNIFIENKLCKVYMLNDFYSFICLLITQIYTRKIMYKRCEYCNSLFATKYIKAKYCKRIATQNAKTCGYASTLEKKQENK